MIFFFFFRSFFSWISLVQKLSIFSLSQNLVHWLIWICRIPWWCSLFSNFDWKYHFWANSVPKIEIVSEHAEFSGDIHRYSFSLLLIRRWKLHLCLFLLNPKYYHNEIWWNTSVLYDRHFWNVLVYCWRWKL